MTVPVTVGGVLPLPVSVALSVTCPPMPMLAELTCVVIVGSGKTPLALSARSWAPQLNSVQASRAMWYGEPPIDEAE